MASGNTQFKVENGLLVQGNSNAAGDFQISGNLIVGGTTVTTGNAQGSITPSPGNTYNLGSITQQWASVFGQNIAASAYLTAPGFLANATFTQISSSLQPSANNIAFGAAAARWALFANTADLLTLVTSGLANVSSANVVTTLAVGGVGTFGANVNISSAANVGGNANVAGTLGVIGATIFSNTVAVSGAVTVTSNTTLKANSSLNSVVLQGNGTVSNISFSIDTFSVTGLATFANTLSVSGAANVGGTFGITGAANALSTLGVTGATSLANTLAVLGAVIVTSNVTFKANSSLTSWQLLGNNTVSNLTIITDLVSITGLVSMANTLVVSGATTLATVNTTGQADFRAAANVAGTFNAIGAAVLGNTLSVAGAVSITSNTTIKANSSVTSVLVQGNNTVSNVTILADVLTFTGLASFANTLSITGAANALSTFGVGAAFSALSTSAHTGAATFANTISVAGLANLQAGVVVPSGNANFRAGLLFLDFAAGAIGFNNATPSTVDLVTAQGNVLFNVANTSGLKFQADANTSKNAAVTFIGNSTVGTLRFQSIDTAAAEGFVFVGVINSTATQNLVNISNVNFFYKSANIAHAGIFGVYNLAGTRVGP